MNKSPAPNNLRQASSGTQRALLWYFIFRELPKLDELNQRYEMDVFTEPVAVVETSLSVLRLTLRVHRKRSVRGHAVFWNPLIKQLEPLACHRCSQPSYSIGFTNEQVDAVCAACSG